MSHVPTMLKSDRSVFEQMLPVQTIQSSLQRLTMRAYMHTMSSVKAGVIHLEI